MKKIIVLGGGAAGWLTALFCKKIYFNCEVQLIESDKIGILGAGEGSTPHLVSFLKFLNIDISDLLTKTKGTIKYGINFENWNGDNKKYFHGFASFNFANKFQVKDIFSSDCYDKYLINCIGENLNLDKFTYGGLLVDNKKNDLENQDFSVHFDAHKIAEYLKNLAITRGVLHKTGDTQSFKQDNSGNITSVILEDGSNEFCDFIFDCSGFKRIIIGKLLKSKWIDYQKYLPMKKAIPFFLNQEEEIAPCTHAIAMKYGWIWKIPLQHRFGAGYIYDSDYINEDQALKEAEEYLGCELHSPRVISFDAGRFENVWVKNCMAVGLSAGFTEPLEATSLYLAVQQLKLLSHFKECLFNAEEEKKKNFNTIMANSNDDILGFLYLHYLTRRKDSDFWINFKQNTTVPEKLKEIIDNLKNNNLFSFNFTNDKAYANFSIESYLAVAYGIGLLNSKKVTKIEGLLPLTGSYKSNMLYVLDNLETHTNFLKNLNANNR